jgi:predicted PurR-regulated permease PerM
VNQAAGNGIGGRWLLIGASAVVLLAGLKAAQSLLIPFLLALFLAIICAPAVSWLARHRVPVGAAVLLVMLVLLALFTAFGAVVGGSVNEFATFASEYQGRFDELVATLSAWLEAHKIDTGSLDAVSMFQPGRLMNLLGGALRSLAAVLSNLFLILLTMIFLMLEAASLPAKMQAIGGAGRLDLEQLRKVVTQVQRYLAIKTATSLATGVLIGVWTAVVGLDFAVVWGLLAFLLNYIPNLGSIVAAVPAVFLALVQEGVAYAALVAIGYVLVNVSIGNFAEPYLMGRIAGLSTLVVFLSLVFWGWMWGSIGMLLSVPLTMILKILFENTDDLRWVAILLDSRRGVITQIQAGG